MTLDRISTIEDYARHYLGEQSEPICNSGNACGTRLELIVVSPSEKYVVCPKCRESGIFPGGVLARLMEVENG
ncbi:MAG TPA: hypothetical protein V6C63_06820 [Allocoleopsis sp.]